MNAGIGSRTVRIAIALTAGLAIFGAAATGAAAKGKLNAEIIRSKGGIPTIQADDFKSLGFGYGYAFAEDNLCTIAEAYVTANGERSRYFGPEGDSPEGYTNLQSDLFYQRIKDRGVIGEILAQPPPVGPKGKVDQVVEGYVAGYNRYLAKTGVANLPDPTCVGAPWVREITVDDVWRRFYQLGQLASGQIAEDGIVEAAPPSASARPAAEPEAVTRADVAELGEALDARMGETGSNGWGLGSEATANGSGMVLGNPHFPWQGSERFYQSHLVVPGKLNVSGASLFGAPVINIGHTDNLAWTHTVSTAFRFVPVQLDLVPGDPTSYYVDGQPVKMESNDVTVQTLQPDGSLAPVTRTLYTTRYGPVINSLQGQPLFGWTEETAFAMFDANADNLRYVNHFLDTNLAQSTNELLDVLKKYEGIPWVNTMASDSRGKALYADIGAIPNVPNAKATGDCAPPIGSLTFGALGLPTVDGSRSECAPGTDPDSVVPGIFGPSNLPNMFRRDYVANSNDSYWLANPAQPLTGFARIIGEEESERSLRERLGLKMIEQRLTGADGYAGDKFTTNRLRRIQSNDRFYSAELFRSTLAAFCHANPNLTNSDGVDVDVSGACAALDGFDEHVNLDSTGAILFRRWFSNLESVPFASPFDVADPINTPAGLDTLDPTVGTALADAVTDLQTAGVPFDAPLGTYQYEPRGAENIPIHGGPGNMGAFNVISTFWDPPAGYPDVTHGSSFIMVAGFSDDGKCVRDRTILTYSESANPASKHYADQTRMYSQKKWLDPPFCPGQVERAARSTKVVSGG